MQIRETIGGQAPVPVEPRMTVNPALMAKKVFLALPWQKNTNPITAFSMANLLDRRRMTACLNFGDAFVAHSRNTCADLFLKSPAEYMLMLDDDVVLPGHAGWYNAFTGFNLPEKFAGMNVLDRLLSHNKKLIGGLYFGKHKHGKPMYGEGVGYKNEEDYARTAPLDLIKPTAWVATGCLLIHRDVFRDIMSRWPRLAPNAQGERSNFFTSSEDAALDAIEDCIGLLSGNKLSGETALKVLTRLEAAKQEIRIGYPLGIGEDVSFCTRAKKVGHTPYVDLGLVLGHIGTEIYGPKNTFRRE